MKMNAELRQPGHIDSRASAARPYNERQGEIDDRRAQPDRPRSRRAPAGRDRGQYSRADENPQQPDQDHKKITSATKKIAPKAIPAAYQRKLPFSVQLSPRYPAAANPAIPS